MRTVMCPEWLHCRCALVQMCPGADETPHEGIPIITPESIRAAQKEDAPICEVINPKMRVES